MKSKDKCTICQTEKECIHCHFGINNQSANPVVISDYMFTSGRTSFAGTFTLPVCETCAKAKGKGPTKTWIIFIVSAVVYAIMAFLLPSSMDKPGVFLPVEGIIVLTLLSISLLAQLVTGMTLLMKSGLSHGKTLALGLIQIFPKVGFLLPLLFKRRIDLNTQAGNALMPFVKESIVHSGQVEEELKRKIENGEVTDSNLIREFNRNESRKQSQQEVITQKARSGRIGYALFGFAITAFIILRGYGVYSANSGYMTWFGIDLTPVTFTLLVAAFIIYDILALVFAVRKRK